MENFWTWLKRANAKAVLGVAVAALLAVTGWWTYKAFAPIAFAPQAVHPVPPPKTAPPLGVLALLDLETKTKTAPAGTNLFALPAFLLPKQEPPAQKTEPTTKIEPPAPKAEPPAPKVEPPKQKSVPTPPRKNVVTITYRGLYHPSSGPDLVLIEDSNSRRSAYYPVGTNLFGWTIDKADMEELTLSDTNAVPATLGRGKTAAFSDGKRMD